MRPEEMPALNGNRAPNANTACVMSVLLSSRPACPVTAAAVNTPSLYVFNAAALTKPHAVKQLSVDFRNYNIDIAAVTEMHFKAKHSYSIVAVPDYTLHVLRRGRGVAAYVQASLQAQIWLLSGNNRTYELLWITFGNLFVDVLYHPPKPSYNVESFLDYPEATV